MPVEGGGGGMLEVLLKVPYLFQNMSLNIIEAKTLRRLSSNVEKTDDTQLLKNVFENIEDMLNLHFMYHGGTVFGKAINEPSSLANTVLAFL